MTYSLSYDISCVCFFHCYPLVAVLDGCTVGTTWELLSLLWDARGLSRKNDVWCKSNAWRGKLSSPHVLNLLSRLVFPEVPGSSARWRLGRFVFVNQQNSQVEPWTKKSPELEYIYPLFPPAPPVSFLPYYTHRQHPDVDITWLAQNNASRSKTHPITYTTLYFPSGLPSATTVS